MPQSPAEVASEGAATVSAQSKVSTAREPARRRVGVGAPGGPSRGRLRLAAAAALLLGVILLGVLLLTAGGEPAPATGATELVPADALVYVHLSTDAARPAIRRSDALLRGLPDAGAGPDSLLDRFAAVVGGSTAATPASLRPWLGREAALALLAGAGTTADSEIILDVRAPALAHAYVTRAGAVAAGRYRGVALLRYPTGAVLAFLRHYLVVGTEAGVRAAIDTDAGGASLAGSSVYGQAVSDAPNGRFLDAYLSGAGVTRVLEPRSGLLGLLGALLDAHGLRGVAVSLSAQSPGLDVHVHSVLAGSTNSHAVSTTLASVLPAGSPLLIEGDGLTAIAPRLFAVMAKLGVLPALPDLLHRLGGTLAADGVGVAHVLSLFGGDTAVALARGSGAPALVIVTRTSDEAAARVTLAGLEAPLQGFFAAPTTGPGLAPESTDVPLAGVTVHRMQLGPGLELDFAVFRGLVVASTSLRGIADVAARSHALADESGFASVLGDHPDTGTTLGFFDLSQLFSYAEQTGVPHDATFRSLRADLAHVREIGMTAAGEGPDTTAELHLHIS